MSGAAPSGGILVHIRHAERWLRRARSDCRRGDVRQAVLRLLLAEAEIRRARESDAMIVAAPPRRVPPAWFILGAVAATVVVLTVHALMKPPVPGPVAAAPSAVSVAPAGQGLGGGVLRFESGGVLPFVGFPTGGRPIRRAGPESVLGVEGDPLLNGADSPALVTFH